VSAHRTSAIALYRALLQQTRAVPLPLQSQQELQNIVRNRCKQAIHLHSYQRLKLAFQAGYEAIDHLDAAVAGDEESTRFIAGLLARAPASVKADPPAVSPLKSKTRGSKSEATTATTSLAQALKPSSELLSRPHPFAQLSGKRQIPVLFNANHIPILRIKKPQPENLSGFIKHRIKQRQRRHDRRHWLVEQIEFAQYEDLWDEIVERQTGLGDHLGGRDEPTWAEEFEISKAEVDQAIWGEGKKNADMAARMQGVVDREREAFEKERRERREAKRVERVERIEKRNARDDEREEAG
jgi:hypothetical protein